MTKRVISKATVLTMAIWIVAQPARALDNNVQIDGVLVSEPCTLDPAGNTLTVDFGTVIAKGLYKDIRTLAKPFVVSLTDCDIALGKEVMLTFSGQESTTLPGMFAASGEGSHGIAIGVETPEGKQISVNQQTPGYVLQNGTTQITLQAFVQADADSIKNHTLNPGAFTATATLDVSYP